MSGECNECGRDGCVESRHDADEMNRTFSRDGEQIFDSSRGYVIVDPDGSVWECDMSGYRITELPEDAVELRPVPAPITAEDVQAALAAFDALPLTEAFKYRLGGAEFVAEHLNRRGAGPSDGGGEG